MYYSLYLITYQIQIALKANCDDFSKSKINCYRCEIFYGSIKTAQRSKQSVCSCVIPSRRSTSIFYAFSCFLLRDDMCMNSFSLVFQLGAK